MKKISILLLLLIFWGILGAKSYTLKSPDGKILVTIDTEPKLQYSVHVGENEVLESSPLSMTINDGQKLGEINRVEKAEESTIKETIKPTVQEKRKTILDYCNELKLQFSGNYGVIFRAYDDGVAYRFYTKMNHEITIRDELVRFNFPGDPDVLLPMENSLFTSQEKTYRSMKLREANGQLAYLPVIVTLENGQRIALTEVHVEDYAGLFINAGVSGTPSFTGVLPKYPTKEAQRGERSERHLYVDERADYIAKTEGNRLFPWRLLVIPENDGDLIETDIVYRLAPPLRLKDTDWIKPGKVAWDWYNAMLLYGVDFKSGVNTKTYKHYVDFAAKHGLEYIILDEGWSDPGDLFKINPDMDMNALLTYALSKNVGIIPWVVWLTLDRQMDDALKMFEDWGVAGIKVDFMDRDDQKIVNWYWTVAEKAAKHHLLLDFHGAYKPTGLRRAYPNVITREAVKGMEYTKWSADVTPEHNVTIPFTRMLAGPMDFTPGATQNANEANFNPVFERPMSLGTRCHQMAMLVVYESPLQMICDSPSHYKREPEMMSFLGPVPSVWDETIVLDARLADYVLIARKSGKDWWLGAMTDWSERKLKVDLFFLGKGKYEAVVFADGPNASRIGIDYTKSVKSVSSKDVLPVHMAPGGGWAAHLKPVSD